MCSSATDLHCESRLRCRGIEHYDDRIKFELQKIGINQLIQASKPAKCCKQTVLNQPSKEELPYAASLASLPLDRADIRVIRQSVRMATQKTECNYTSMENRTKLVYYANLVKDNFDDKKPKDPQVYKVCYFYLTLDDTDTVRNALKKSHSKGSSFKFFQIFNWSEKISKGSAKGPTQAVDLATSLDFKQLISSNRTDENLRVISQENSTDALEDMVFSDLFHVKQSGVGDSKPGNSLDDNCIHDLNLKKTRKKNQKLNINFTMTESSFENDSLLFENKRNCNSLAIDSVENFRNFQKTYNSFSQTDMTHLSPELSRHSILVDVGSQTINRNRKVVIDNRKFSEEIMRLLSSSESDGLQYLKQNTNCLVYTSDATLETDSLEVHMKSGNFKANLDNDEDFEHATQDFEDAIKDVLGEIRQLASMAESLKSKEFLFIKESVPKSRDYMTQNTICSTLEEFTSPLTEDGSPKGNEIVLTKTLSASAELFRKQISKGQFIVRMYNSVNEIIGEIYGEAEKLAKLRRNRIAISGKKENVEETRCKKSVRHFDAEKKISPAKEKKRI